LKIFKDFVTVYEMISSVKPDPNEVEKLAKDWVTSFISFSSTMEVHHKSNMTPYMHIMAYHIPDVMRRFVSTLLHLNKRSKGLFVSKVETNKPN
jgi:hypothetical protein